MKPVTLCDNFKIHENEWKYPWTLGWENIFGIHTSDKELVLKKAGTGREITIDKWEKKSDWAFLTEGKRLRGVRKRIHRYPEHHY